MALYSPDTYDSFYKTYTRTQCVNGGKKRAATAKRDRYGRMMPNDTVSSIPDPVAHGKPGGMARVRNALRDNKGRFTK